MKICVLQGAFLPIPPIQGGGAEKMWYLLAQKFAERGHEVVQVSRSWPALPDKEDISKVKHLRVSGFSTPGSLVLLKTLDLLYTLRAIWLVPNNAQIVVTNTFWAPILLPFIRKAKIYVDVARMPKGQMRLYSRVSRLRGNSSPVAAAILRELPVRSSNLVKMIPNPLPHETEEKVNLEVKSNVILYCGRIHPEKGLDLLVEAVKSLPVDWELKIVGPWSLSTGGGGDSYYTSIKNKLFTRQVSFLGAVFDVARLNELYREASIFLYPSVAEKGETFGLAPLEAMAWGCVPIVSDLDCFKDFIADNVNGLIFNHRANDAQSALAIAIFELVKDSARRKRLAANAMSVRYSHSPARIAENFLSDFQSLLA